MLLLVDASCLLVMLDAVIVAGGSVVVVLVGHCGGGSCGWLQWGWCCC